MHHDNYDLPFKKKKKPQPKVSHRRRARSPQRREAAAAEATGGMKVPVTPRCSPGRRASGTPPADVGGTPYNP